MHRPLLEKGESVARRGRKVTGQAKGLTAGLPKERGESSFPGRRRLSMSRGGTASGCASELRGELALTHIALCVTVIASVLSLGGILLSLVEDVAIGRWVASLGQGLFL